MSWLTHHVRDKHQPSEQHFGLHTPPFSPPLTPTIDSAQTATSSPVPTSRRSRPSPSGSSGSIIVPSLFPDAYSDADNVNDDSMMMSYTENFYYRNASVRAQPTANELWLQRTHRQQVVEGPSGPMVSSSWMPAPSSSVSIRPRTTRRQTSAGSSVGRYDARHVRFAWGTAGGDDEDASFDQNNDRDDWNGNGDWNGYGGGRRNIGYGSSAVGSKRSWAGRHEVDGERDDDENEEDTMDEEHERRARRRAR